MNDLDQLLRSWNQRNEPSEALLAELHRQAIARLNSFPALTVSQARNPSAVISKRRGKLAVVCAFAASFLVAFGIFRTTEPVGKQSSSDAIRIVVASARNSQSLFSELDRMFDGRWQSLCVQAHRLWIWRMIAGICYSLARLR